MLPRNFPGRVNGRRRDALDRVEKQLARDTKHNSGAEYPLTPDDRARLNAEANRLSVLLRSDADARAVRTKKLRVNGWTAARAAYRSGRLA